VAAIFHRKTMSDAQALDHSALGPLRHGRFRSLWLAGVGSNVGASIHMVAASWLMTDLSPSPLMVSLVQFSMSLPLFVLALPAGALADVLNRKHLLIATNLSGLLCAALLAVVGFTGLISPISLLALSLGIGIALALANPVWQTMMTEMVPARQIVSAASLNSLSLNLSRSVGPIVGGVIVASVLGPPLAFLLNALSFVVLLAVLMATPSPQQAMAMRAERFLGAIKAGLRYARHSRPLAAVMIRTVGFVVFAACLWGLMPIVARTQLGLGAKGYGFLLAALGLGAVTAAFTLPPLRRRFSPQQIVTVATLGYGAGLLGVALVPGAIAAFVSVFVCGACWLTMVTSLNSSAQTNAPAWVRGRALACYLSVFFGSFSLGLIVFGWLAGSKAAQVMAGVVSDVWGVVGNGGSESGLIVTPLQMTFVIAAAGLFVSLPVLAPFRLQHVSREDLELASAWDDPVVASPIKPEDGPVVVTVKYRIAAEDIEAFTKAMGEVAVTRYRDGAITWTLTQQTEDPQEWLEIFICESWEEHLRQHHRVTKADARLQAKARSFHQGPGKPEVRHHIAAAVKATIRS
jgi:quinol monooxygenase YgiN/Na+/melibiose symporter-like transporter